MKYDGPATIIIPPPNAIQKGTFIPMQVSIVGRTFDAATNQREAWAGTFAVDREFIVPLVTETMKKPPVQVTLLLGDGREGKITVLNHVVSPIGSTGEFEGHGPLPA